jgi:lipopolysaccharide assembly protein A
MPFFFERRTGNFMIRFIFVVLPLLVLFLFAVAFGALNQQQLSVDLLIGRYQMPLTWVVAGFLVIGFVLGLLSMLARQLGLRKQLRQQRKAAPKTS